MKSRYSASLAVCTLFFCCAADTNGAKIRERKWKGALNSMKSKSAVNRWRVRIVPISFFLLSTLAQAAQEQPPASEVTPDKWPKTVEVEGTQYTIYQPQLESWDGYHFEARAAASVLAKGARQPIFGVVKTTAVTYVDRLSRIVHFYNARIVDVNFPSTPAKEVHIKDVLQKMLSRQDFAPSLGRMEAALAVLKAEKKGHGVPVKNKPPGFIFSQVPAVLIQVDGEPVWRTIKGTGLVRVLNTRALILGDKSGSVYLHLFDGFLDAPSLSGPWKVAQKTPPDAEKIARELAKENVVDLMAGPPDEKTEKAPSLKAGAPRVLVVTSPTELIVTEGKPDWVPIPGTMLLYVKNTTGSIFKDLNDQSTYVLATGRWFKAPGFDGPWQYVKGKELPKDFAAIPDDSPKENVKASVPGTPQAREAVIANEIPQTAKVYRQKARFTPQISGTPELKPVPDTPLSYVFNSPTPIIRVSPTSWYAVQSGVWFTASSLGGPWVVATSVPAVIYSIPPSSPIYYATYVKIYSVTPDYVVVGYTPGYMGAIVSSDGVVVYGTGYTYVPYIGPTVWYSPPVTYGYAANPTWTPWTGWAIGFGLGWAFGAATFGHYCYAPAPHWGPMPYAPHGGYAWGPHGGAAWGPGGWAATTGNVYSHWGPKTAVSRTSAGYNAWTGNAWSSKVGRSYNSTTGRISAGQKAAVGNVYTGNYAYGKRGATYNPNTGVAARGGTVTGGNADSGNHGTATWGKVKGPGGGSTSAAKVNNDVYAGHDGNVYRNTGNGWQRYDNGGWNTVQKPAGPSGQAGNRASTESLDSQRWARQAGDQRSAASAWGSNSWGGGFDHGGGAVEPGFQNRPGRPMGDGERGFEGGQGGDFGGGRRWGGGEFGGGRFGRR